ncbi:GerMN domain-containing protein [Facklamia sp. DSM 111018]|uniref:GerMN domain-containing protein n=1 Tax=Facklamia lactis TaxID=2749967 RepID=A0ABS0LV35_9LACT|nr:GerMN domain-containing protein [Facklamia lactis]MBG9981298.1 GerMN domain-containing protein [Facklamia lactis]MBG9987226.1 GerMN domain-containing protein [Facklamia lactis]
MFVVKKLLFLGVIFILVGCSREPMIQLSEENRIKIESKIAEKTTTEEKIESSIETQPNESTKETQASPNKENPNITIDTSKWEQAAEGTEYSIMDFIPFRANQIKKFSDDMISYVDHYDESSGQMQVRQIKDNKTMSSLYQWDGNQIKQFASFQPENVLRNYLDSEQYDNTLSQPLVLLAAPIVTGNRWTYDGQNQSEITAIYENVEIDNKQFSQVVEVTTDTNDKQVHQLYAKDYGLIATWDEQNKLSSYLKEYSTDVMLVYNIDIYVPVENENGSLIEKQVVPFSWQTDDTLASALKRLFQEQKWIGQEIDILDISKEEDIGEVDFTSGVVADLNKHPAGEQAVIAALVSTTAEFLKVDKVRLEVYGNGMLPATIDYPPNGIYTIDPTWLNQTNSTPSTEEITETTM